MKQNLYQLYLLGGIIFLICPILGILLFVLISYDYNKKTYSGLYFFSFLISLYLGLLNTTKVLISDGLRYYEAFHDASKYDIITYVLDYGKEPIYRIYTYISYYLFSGNWEIFIICTTLIFYLLLSHVIISVGKYINASYYNIIAGIFITSFFFQQFSLSAHLIRQCLAEGFLLYYMSVIYLYNKKKYLLGLVPVFIHSTTLPICGIISIPQIGQKLTIKKYFIIISAIVVLIIASTYFFSLLSNIPIIGYIYHRITSESLLGTEARQTEFGFSLIGLLLSISVLYMSISTLRRKYLDKSLYAYLNFIIILIMALFVMHLIEAYYLFERYFFFMYSILGIIFMIYNHYTKTFNRCVVSILMILLLFYFYYKLENNDFTYESVLEALFLPVPLYFI